MKENTYNYQWCHNTKVKYSIILEGFVAFMKDTRVKNTKTAIYDNRHHKLKEIV